MSSKTKYAKQISVVYNFVYNKNPQVSTLHRVKQVFDTSPHYLVHAARLTPKPVRTSASSVI